MGASVNVGIPIWIGWSNEECERAPYVLVFDTPWFLRKYKEQINDSVSK